MPYTTIFGDTFEKINALKSMIHEYNLMKSNDYKYLDDYYHCKANYNATQQGAYGEEMAKTAGFGKEIFYKMKNTYYKRMTSRDVEDDFRHDLFINALGRARAKFGKYSSAIDACADFRERNPNLSKQYW